MTTYYVDGAVGDDANSGLVEGAGNAWATIQKAADTAIVGDDIVYIKNSVTYTEQITQSIATSAGYLSPIHFIGYSSIPGDDGRIVIDGENTRTNCWQTTYQNMYLVFKNITFTRATTYAFNASFGAGDSVYFYNCAFTNNTSHGVWGDNNIMFMNCDASNNGGSGIDVDNQTCVIGCTALNNASFGITCSGSLTLYKSLVKGNQNGARHTLGDNPIFANTIVDNTLNGGDFYSNTFSFKCVDNIFSGNDVGLRTNGNANVGMNEIFDYNLFFNNTTADQVIPYVNPLKDNINSIYQDPAFADAGSDDYTLSNASAAINAGVQPGLVT